MKHIEDKPKKRFAPALAIGFALLIGGSLFLQCARHSGAARGWTVAPAISYEHRTALSGQPDIPLSESQQPAGHANSERVHATDPSSGNNLYLDIMGLEKSILDMPWLLETIELWNQLIGHQFFILQSVTKGAPVPYRCDNGFNRIKIVFNYESILYRSSQYGLYEAQWRQRQAGRQGVPINFFHDEFLDAFFIGCKFKKRYSGGSYSYRVGFMARSADAHMGEYGVGYLDFLSAIQSDLKNINIFINEVDDNEEKVIVRFKEQLFLYLGTIYALYAVNGSQKTYNNINIRIEGLENIKNQQYFKEAIIWWNNKMGQDVLRHTNSEEDQKISGVVHMYSVQDASSRPLLWDQLHPIVNRINVRTGNFQAPTRNYKKLNLNDSCSANDIFAIPSPHSCNTNNGSQTVDWNRTTCLYSGESFSFRVVEDDGSWSYGHMCNCVCQREDIRLPEQFLLRLGVILALNILNKDI